LKALTTIAWLLGLGLVVALVLHEGAGALTHAMALAGVGLFAAPLAHLPSLFVDTLGWWVLLSGERSRPGFTWLLLFRWVGVAVNGTLPVAQVGGEIARARLLALSGPSGAVAGASVVVDLTLGLLTQTAFALMGLAVLIGAGRTPIGLGALALVLIAVAAFVVAFALVQSRGLFRRLAEPVERFAGGRGWWDLAGSAEALDEAVAGIWQRRRTTALAALLRFAGWVIGSLELWVAFHVLGHPIGVAEAIALEATAQVVRSAAFVIPGGLGAQEGGLLLAGSWLGLPAEITLAAALLKRAREIMLGAAGLLLWSLLESARAQQSR
jgi:glycosyltransferase 2 family protein